MYTFFMYIGTFLLETAHGEEPFFWFKAPCNPVQFSSVQFSSVQFSSVQFMLKSDNPFVRNIQAADVPLAEAHPGVHCWTYEFCAFLVAQPWGAPFAQAVREWRPFRVPDMELSCRRCDIAQWRAHENCPADAEMLPPELSRMCTTYQQWFAIPTFSATQWAKPKRAGTG